MTHKNRKTRKPLRPYRIQEAKWAFSSEDGEMTLNLPDIATDDLPTVSIVTITKNRKKLFQIPIYNWTKIVYPEDKIEWVILDDGTEDLSDILPDDKRIRYVKCDEMDIGDKRNRSVELSNYEYIVHMDDDDYYFPESVLAKIRVLKHYNKQCIYSHNLGVYDILTKSSAIMEKYIDVPELTMAYTKNFWKDRKFGNAPYESKQMVYRREPIMIKLPFWFNAIACTHNTNYTQRLKSINVSTVNLRAAPLADRLFNPEFKKLIDSIGQNL